MDENHHIAGHSTNLLGVPTDLLASAEFNEHPIPLSVSGTREAHRGFFAAIEKNPERASLIFRDYMALVFGLDAAHEEGTARRYRASYLRLLKDWGYDANSPAGAVLKGWVESRFGLFPSFHKEPIRRFNSHAWLSYVSEKMSSRFHNNSIYMQLDLLYEFCQWSLFRLHRDTRHLSLFRGSNDLAEHRLLQKLNRNVALLRLNNLVSFTSNPDIADEFGDIILEAQVPFSKIFFYNDLLASHPLRGEAEYLVIGGDYRVKMSYWRRPE